MAGLTASRIPPRIRTALRIAAGVAIVAATVLAVGAGPFLRGIASVSIAAVLAAVGLAAVASAAAAWRWRVVAGGLGLPLPWRTAFGAYYRSQFLNSVLPGGILGDVHRAYAHGRTHARVGGAVRAVAAERIAGQLVQTVVTVVILVPLGFASALAPLAVVGVILVAVVLVVLATVPRARRAVTAEVRMLRPVLAKPSALLAVVTASVVVVAAHVSTFVVAGIAVGVAAEPRRLALLALLVLSAAAIPVNVGGWGPREAASAGAFAIAGLGGAAGVAVSVAFGVLAMIAVAPGALVLLGERRHDRARPRREGEPA